MMYHLLTTTEFQKVVYKHTYMYWDALGDNNYQSFFLENMGKLLRPKLVYLWGKQFSIDLEIIEKIAVASELIHGASLVHDDILDHAETRRFRSSAHVIWGTEEAVLLGDLLYSIACQLLASIGQSSIVQEYSAVMTAMTIGELQQKNILYTTNISFVDYTNLCKQKTGVLFATCMSVLAPKIHKSQIYDFGIQFGILFQYIDDYLDYFMINQTMGKPKKQDLQEGKITLPIFLSPKKKNILHELSGLEWKKNPLACCFVAENISNDIAAQNTCLDFLYSHKQSLVATLKQWNLDPSGSEWFFHTIDDMLA
jgi:geranylgeranyl pyrophosphate synthase